MGRFLTLFLIASLALLGAAGPAQSAKKPPKLPKKFKVPKVTAYWADVEISGSIRIYTHWDTTSTCLPGQTWTLDEVANVRLTKRTFISVVRGRVAGGLVRNKRAINQASDLGGYRTTNYCDGPKAELKKPDCKPSITGNGKAFIQSFPGQKRRVVVFVTRTSGASQDSSCQTGPAEVDSLNASIHAFQNRWQQLRLPLKLENIGFENMKPGWKHRSQINVNGSCDDAKITYPESDWVTKQSISYESCTVTASYTVTIARVKPKKPKGKKAKKPKAKAKKAK